jgi:hypothetical protein
MTSQTFNYQLRHAFSGNEGPSNFSCATAGLRCAKIIAISDSLLDPYINNNKHPTMIKTPAEMTP